MNKLRFLMCPPTFFEVSYRINDWMHPEEWLQGDYNKAQLQWRDYLDTLQGLGAEIELITPAKGLPDMCFAANAGYFDKNNLQRFVPSYFKNDERYAEAYWYSDKLNDLGYSSCGVPRKRPSYPMLYQEGHGDIIPDSYRNLYWIGYGQRTEYNAAQEIVGFASDDPPTLLELVDPVFYHLDTCFLPLPDGEIMYYPWAFSVDALNKIATQVKEKHRIMVTAEEAEMFCCNAVVIDDNIVMSQCTERLKRLLADRGYKVIESNLSVFHKAGGSAACLVLRLPEIKS